MLSINPPKSVTGRCYSQSYENSSLRLSGKSSLVRPSGSFICCNLVLKSTWMSSVEFAWRDHLRREFRLGKPSRPRMKNSRILQLCPSFFDYLVVLFQHPLESVGEPRDARFLAPLPHFLCYLSSYGVHDDRLGLIPAHQALEIS